MTFLPALPAKNAEGKIPFEAAMAYTSEALAHSAVTSRLAGRLATGSTIQGKNTVASFDEFYDYLKFMSEIGASKDTIGTIMPGEDSVNEFWKELKAVVVELETEGVEQ